MCFSRKGLQVIIPQDQFDLAQSLLAKGVNEILFTAKKLDAHSLREVQFVLVTHEIVNGLIQE